MEEVTETFDVLLLWFPAERGITCSIERRSGAIR